MRIIERSREDIDRIIRDHREVYTVRVTGAAEDIDPPTKQGWRAHVSILAAGTTQEHIRKSSNWLFATQADAMSWGYWLAATWLEAESEQRI